MSGVLTEAGDCDVLFRSDQAAGSPLREAAAICTENPGCACAPALVFEVSGGAGERAALNVVTDAGIRQAALP